MNLLPSTERKLLKKGLRRRFFIAFLFLIIISFVVGIVMLLPSYILSRRSQITISPTMGYQLLDEQEINEYLNLPTEIDAKLKVLQVNLNEESVVTYLSKVSNGMSSKVKLTSVSFNRSQTYKDKLGTSILLSGMALDRESLVDFSNSLKASEAFTLVDVPISNLTKDKNVPFSINLFVAK